MLAALRLSRSGCEAWPSRPVCSPGPPYRLLYCCEGRVARGGERLVKPVARDSRLARELGTLLLESLGRW